MLNCPALSLAQQASLGVSCPSVAIKKVVVFLKIMSFELFFFFIVYYMLRLVNITFVKYLPISATFSLMSVSTVRWHHIQCTLLNHIGKEKLNYFRLYCGGRWFTACIVSATQIVYGTC